MKPTFIYLSVPVLALSLLVAGCSRAPQDELHAAQQALQTADSTEADLYVPELYQAAHDSFAVAQGEIAAQDAAGTFSRDYERAVDLLAYVHATAEEATALVDVRKDELRTANEALFIEAQQAIARANEIVAQAPPSNAVALVALEEDSGSAAQLLADAQAAQAVGEYAGAHDLAKAALEKANTVVAGLETGATQPTPTPRS